MDTDTQTEQAQAPTAPVKSSRIITGVVNNPQRTLIYGVPGVGKSTFASMAPAPIFIQTEDGLDAIGADRFPKSETFGEVMDNIEELARGGYGYKTLAVDSLDWMERLVWQHICFEEKKKSIEDFGFGKGYIVALRHWATFLRALTYLRSMQGMEIILTAHSQVVKVTNPEGDSYDRFEPRLHKTAVALITEWCDNVLFANFKVLVGKKDEGFGKSRGVGIHTGDRILRTSDRPAHSAKHRRNMPDEIPLDYRIFSAHVRGETVIETEPNKEGD